jgi:hypothetical protein
VRGGVVPGALRAAGYSAVWHGKKGWNGVAILARGAEPVETRRGLPGDPDDTHSRYIEATISSLIVGLPVSAEWQPAPGPEIQLQAAVAEIVGNPHPSCRRGPREPLTHDGRTEATSQGKFTPTPEQAPSPAAPD